MVAGEAAFSELNGPPGIAFMAKKVMALITITVRKASRTRFMMYLPKNGHSLVFRFPSGKRQYISLVNR
jgi:hypothetical protein